MDEYTKKLEDENAILNKKVMDYEDIIKKLDPTFFQMKGVVEENIAEENEDVYGRKGYIKFNEFYNDLRNMHGIDMSPEEFFKLEKALNDPD